jgi:outer membrane protein
MVPDTRHVIEWDKGGGRLRLEADTGSVGQIFALLLIILATPSVHGGTTLEFGDVINAALKHSYDVRTSTIDVGISRSMLRQTRSLYFPELNTRFNSQYVKDLTGGTQQVTAIGTTILLQNTMYQSSVSLNASYNLYDFGARENRMVVADKDILAKQAVLRQSVRDTKLKVLEVYRDLLLLSMELNSKKELLTLYKDLSLTKERLFKAGNIRKIEMVEDAIKVVKTIDAMDNLKLKLISSLQDLAFYTGSRYDADSIKISRFREPEGTLAPKLDLEKSPEWRIYELEIEKKKAEIEILKRERLPQLSLYSNYIYYGQDQDSLNTSLGALGARNFYVGMTASMPLFDGFKNSAQIDKATLEKERLKIEKEKKLAELTSRHEKLTQIRNYYTAGLTYQEEIMARVDENLSMVRRLTDEKVAEYAELLTRRIEAAIEQYELQKTQVMKTAAAVELRILSEVQE